MRPQNVALSKAQYGIYAECAGHTGEVCYNLPYLYTLDGSLDGIPVLWVMSHVAPHLLWYSYLIAYVIEALFIVVIHRMSHLKFELKTEK